MELDDLSEGWSVKRLSDPNVATLNPKKSELNGAAANTEVTFVPMSAVDDGSGTIARPEVRRLSDVRKGYTYFKEADVIFAKITPCMENGKSAIARGLRNGIGFGSTEFHVVRAGTEILPEWLHLILRSQQVRDDAENAMHGAAGQQRVPVEFLEQLEIPVPPLAEQRRIVARVEALTRRLDQARQARQAALAEAETFLPAEMDRLFSAMNAERMSISDLGEVRGGIQKTPDRLPGANPVRYLTVAHVRRDKILFDDLRYFEVDPDELKLRRLEAGDVLIIEGNGSADQIGRAALFRGEIADCVHQNHVIRVRPNCALVEPAFLNAFLNSPAGQQEVQNRGRTSTGLLSLSVGRIRTMEIPIPKLGEQRAIVARLDALRGKLDELQRLQREVETELAAFTPALLAKAFRGEL